MSETVSPPQNRAYLPDRDAIYNLARIATMSTDEKNMIERRRLYDSLPAGLSTEEISALGGRVSNFVELVAPSHDGYSHGRKSEIRAIHWLGTRAFVHGDETTLNSSINHLRSLGFAGKLAAGHLWWERRGDTRNSRR